MDGVRYREKGPTRENIRETSLIMTEPSFIEDEEGEKAFVNALKTFRTEHRFRRCCRKVWHGGEKWEIVQETRTERVHLHCIINSQISDLPSIWNNKSEPWV